MTSVQCMIVVESHTFKKAPAVTSVKNHAPFITTSQFKSSTKRHIHKKHAWGSMYNEEKLDNIRQKHNTYIKNASYKLNKMSCHNQSITQPD